MLYAPVNITAAETKTIKSELFKFLHSWVRYQKNSDLLYLESQFIGLDKHELPTKIQAPVLHDVLCRMQIDHAWRMLCFIVVSDNKEFPIHIDDYDQTWTAVGMNVPVLNCQDSKTVWYDSIPDTNPAMPDYISSLSHHATIATKCVSLGVKEIGSCDANIPHWINVSVPHAPVCSHSKLRINSSLRFQLQGSVEDFFTDTKFEHCMTKKLL